MKYIEKNHSLNGYTEGDRISQTDVLTGDCEIIVPAATGSQIDRTVASKLRCRILAEGANGPTTTDGDAVLKERSKEIFVIPDVLANAGGVTVSYFEWVQGLQNFFWDADEVNAKLQMLMVKAFKEVIKVRDDHNVYMRVAAQILGIERVKKAMLARGLYP